MGSCGCEQLLAASWMLAMRVLSDEWLMMAVPLLQVEAAQLKESEKANAAHNDRRGARQHIKRIDKELKALQVGGLSIFGASRSP